jgi:hypothetical protein
MRIKTKEHLIYIFKQTAGIIFLLTLGAFLDWVFRNNNPFTFKMLAFGSLFIVFIAGLYMIYAVANIDICEKCGKYNRKGSLFCSECGKELNKKKKNR